MSDGAAGLPAPPPWDWIEAEDVLLLAAVLLLPWAFGGVEIWAYRTASLLLVSAAAVALAKHGWQGLELDRRSRWLLPAVLLGLWGLLQAVPLPPTVIGKLSPTADRIYRESLPNYPAAAPESVSAALEEAALARVPELQGMPAPPPRDDDLFLDSRARGWSAWRSLSLLPSAGSELSCWYFALLLGFLVARRRTRDPEVARHYRNALFATFAGLAVFGLVYAATANGRLYWVRSPAQSAQPFGPYVNPTNFAAVMELGVPWLAGCAAMQLRREGGSLLALMRRPIFAAGMLICLLAGLLTGSKFAGLQLAVGVTLILVVAVLGRRSQWPVLGALAVAWIGIGFAGSRMRLGERLQEFFDVTAGGYGELGRLAAWKAAMPMVTEFPICGIGFGAFGDVYQRYVGGGSSARWSQLHNDYLQLLIEGGAVAAVLVVWLAFGFWRRALRAATSRQKEGIDIEAVGLVLGLAALTIHAVVDFNLQIPANALLFTVLAAIAVVQGERPAEESR